MSPKSPSQTGAERILGLPKYEANETVIEAAENWVKDPSDIEWKSICNDKNNRGDVEIVETDIQGIVELLTNSSDAYLIEHTENSDSREELLESLDDERVLVEFTGDSNGNYESEYSVVIADKGCGVPREQFEDAFLKDPSTGGVDKRKYQYLYGEFGQGSLASIGVSKKGCKFVASASKEDRKKWSWSVTRYNEERKRYEYLTVNGYIPTFNGRIRVNEFGLMTHGTITKVFDIDSTQTPRNVTRNPFIRRLGHSFPETAVPLNIIDNRNGQYEKRVWSGMKNELDESSKVQKISTQISVGKFGKIGIDAYIVDENESFDNEFINSQNRDRIFYTVYGMTHHTESLNKLKNDCGLKGINEDTLLFVDCSNLTIPINDIFLPARTGMKKAYKSKSFVNNIHGAIEDWSEIQEIDNERATLADLLDTDGESPLESVEFPHKESPVPVYEVNDTLEATIKVESEVENYCERDNVDIELIGVEGRFNTRVDGNEINLEMSVFEDARVTVCVTDSEFDTSITGTFSVSCENKDPKIKSGITKIPEPQTNEKQDDSTGKYEFEDKVVSLVGPYLQNKNRIVQESNTDNGNALKYGTGWQDLESVVEFLINESGQEVSSRGGSNHPPDHLIKNGPGIETKKLNSVQDVPTNSSMPKHKISPENDKLKDETKEVLRSSNKAERDMFYAIGTKNENELKVLWIVQATTVFNQDGYEKKLQEAIENLHEGLESKQFDVIEDSNEPARVKNAGQKGNINSRFRLMHSFKHPENVYSEYVQSLSGDTDSPMVIVIEKEKYQKLKTEDKTKIKQLERITKETVVLDENTTSVVLVAE